MGIQQYGDEARRNRVPEIVHDARFADGLYPRIQVG
jgi:hypothetical protein